MSSRKLKASVNTSSSLTILTAAEMRVTRIHTDADLTPRYVQIPSGQSDSEGNRTGKLNVKIAILLKLTRRNDVLLQLRKAGQ